MLEISVKKKLTAANGSLQLDLNFNCKSQEFLVISGQSGAGKTSLLRMIAGLMKPESGYIRHFGETLSEVTDRWSWPNDRT